MDKTILDAVKVNGECHAECEEALLMLAEACQDTDELRYCNAWLNFLRSWIRCKRSLESAYTSLLAKAVERNPEDFGGMEFLASARRCAAKAKEAALEAQC